MQFIDGRLDLLNSGKGFNDIFEDEINMGEYAGELAVMFTQQGASDGPSSYQTQPNVSVLRTQTGCVR